MQGARWWWDCFFYLQAKRQPQYNAQPVPGICALSLTGEELSRPRRLKRAARAVRPLDLFRWRSCHTTALPLSTMRVKRTHALMVLCALGLAAVYVAVRRYPQLPASVAFLTDDSAGDSREQSEGDVDETELEELLQILKPRLDSYTGPIRNWTEEICDSKNRGASLCFDAACPRQFSPSLRERLRQVLSTRAPLPEQYMRALASAARSVTSHKYIFVTGASSNHFLEMQALLRTVFDSLLPKIQGEDYALVVYNLGFNETEKKLTEKNCRCTVVDFPFSEMPENVQFLKCYQWKPLIMASLLEKAEYLTWMDASIRFRKSDPFPELFRRARDNGYQTKINRGSIAVRTRPGMADFFGDQLCQYSSFSEMETNFFILYNDRFTRDAVMKPWLSCAFADNCMCIKNHHKCHGSGSRRVYGDCHRYEQSSIGMIFSKLYLEKRPMLHAYKIQIKRDTYLDWFESR